jgi:hypothetical protein
MVKNWDLKTCNNIFEIHICNVKLYKIIQVIQLKTMCTSTIHIETAVLMFVCFNFIVPRFKGVSASAFKQISNQF